MPTVMNAVKVVSNLASAPIIVSSLIRVSLLPSDQPRRRHDAPKLRPSLWTRPRHRCILDLHVWLPFPSLRGLKHFHTMLNVMKFLAPKHPVIPVRILVYSAFEVLHANTHPAHYRNAIIHELPTPGGDPKASVSTTYEVFEVTAKANPKFKCLGQRPITSGNVEDPKSLQFRQEFSWQTYGEVAQRRLNLGSGIQALFNDGTVGGGELPTVGTWTINRPEWQLIDLALAAYSKVGVALYSTLGRNSVGRSGSSCF